MLLIIFGLYKSSKTENCCKMSDEIIFLWLNILP